MLDHEPPGVRAVAPRVPTFGGASGKSSDRLDRIGHMVALDALADLLIRDPAPSMTRDFVAVFKKCVHDGRIARKRHADTTHCQRKLSLAEQPQQAPDTGA